MQTRALISVGIVGLFGLIAMPGLAQESPVPQLINYQGRLAASEGGPPPTKDYKLSFSIYDKPAAVSCLRRSAHGCARRVWGPQVFDGKNGAVGHGDRVPVVKGFFSVLLGPYDTSGKPIAQAFASSDRFVEVTVEDAEPNLPRQQVFSAPFALGSLGETPVGGIIMFTGRIDELPGNWKVCNGQRVQDSDSPFHGERVPDLRDIFVRGAMNTEEVGSISGRNRHALHGHSFEGTVHTSTEVINYYGDEYVHDIDFFGIADMTVYMGSRQALVVDSNHKSHGHTIRINEKTSRDDYTDRDNRPRHMALHYIIRVK